MANFSDYTKLTYVNSTSPAINATNLNKNEDSLELIMDELNYAHGWTFKNVLSYCYNMSTRCIEKFFDLSDGWTFTGTVNEYDILFVNEIKIGKSGIRMEETDASSGTLEMYKTLTTIDCTSYPGGTTSYDNDYIVMIFHLSDATKFSNVQIRLGNNAANFYYYNMTYATGHNVRLIRKSVFSVGSGSPSWSTISYINIRVITTASATGEYITMQGVFLTRRDAVITESTPWFFDDGQGNMSDKPYINNALSSLVYYDDYCNKMCYQLLEENTSPAFDDIMCDVNSFAIKLEAYCKYDGFGPAVIWYIDASNYFIVEVDSNALNFYEYVGASGSNVATQTLDITIVPNDRMELFIEKTSDNVIRASLNTDGQRSVFQDYETSFSTTAQGCVGFVNSASGMHYTITDMVIGYSQASLPNFLGSLELGIYKYQNEYLNNSTTVQNDNALLLKLPPNTTFEIFLNIIALSSSDVPDIKVKWILTNDYEVITYRSSIGPPTSVSNVSDTQLKNGYYDFSTEIPYGIDGTANESYIFERCVLTTGNDGLKIQIRWAQNTSSGTETCVRKGSYIRARKI
jgi:hypothetical protein